MPQSRNPVTPEVQAQLEELAALVLTQTKQVIGRRYPEQAEGEKVEVTAGAVYTRIDRGPEHGIAGYLMVDHATGEIFGIRGYGKVHPGRRYGTLTTMHDWFWGEYSPSLVTS